MTQLFVSLFVVSWVGGGAATAAASGRDAARPSAMQESAAQAGPEAAAEGPALTPEERDKLLRRGAALAEKLPRLAAGQKAVAAFQIMLGPDTVVGYARVTVTAAEEDGKLLYRYRNETGIRFGTDARTLTAVEGSLEPTFEPVRLKADRMQIDPDGKRQRVTYGADLGDEKVNIWAKAAGQEGSKEVDRPEGPLVYGIEMFVEQLDLNRSEPFLIREFDMSTGGARDLTLTVETWKDGAPTVVTRTAEGAGSYQFWFDDEGQLIRFGEPSMPVLFVRTTPEQIVQMQRDIGRVEPQQDSEKAGAGRDTEEADEVPGGGG